MYHWEANQEDFLVLAGEALLDAEGEERPLRQWDFVHCPAEMNHTIVGAGEGPCVVFAVGARQHGDDETWGGYTVNEAALRHRVGVEEETSNAEIAYARSRLLGRLATAAGFLSGAEHKTLARLEAGADGAAVGRTRRHQLDVALAG